MHETAPPNMDLAAIQNRLAERSARLFDDRTFIRRKKAVAMAFRFVAVGGADVAIAENDTFTDAENVTVTAKAVNGKFRLQKPDGTFAALAVGDKYRKDGKELSVEEAPAGWDGSELSGGTKIRVLTQNGTYRVVTVGDTYIDERGKEITVAAGQKWKRSVRVLVRQWIRIPDREREPLYRFLGKYASVKNVEGTDESQWTTTCWVKDPMIDGEERSGFWKMLRTWESRYRMQDPEEQGVFQALLCKGGWELDDVPAGAGDDETEGDAAACIASSPLHHIDREIFLGSSEVPSCGHRNERGHMFEAAGSFNDETGMWEGRLDDDIARDPGDFVTWSGSRYLHRCIVSGTHKRTTSLPTKEALDERIKELAKDNIYNYEDESGTEQHVSPPFRDEYGRPRRADGTAYNDSPWEEYESEEGRAKYGNVIANAQRISGQKKIDMSMMGADVEASADLDNYGLFSTREHRHTAQTRRVFVKDGGHIHDSWTFKAWKSAFLPTQRWVVGQTLNMMVDLDDDGLFNFTKTINFAHPWEAWHAKKDEDSISVVFEFHNRKSSSVPNRSTAKEEGLKVLSKFGYKIDGNSLLAGNGLVSRDYDQNEYGMHDGKASYIFPFESVNMGTTATRNKFGETSRIHSWRNVPDGSFIEDDNRGYILKRTGKPDIVYARPDAGKTLSFRKRLNDFGLYNITVQENDAYPEGFGEVYKYTTRKGRFQRNQTIIQDGREISEFRGYCYWADVEVKTFSNEKDANDFVTAGNSSEYNVVKGTGKWNDGSGVSYEGNGVWVGRKITHHYSGEVPRNKEEVPR